MSNALIITGEEMNSQLRESALIQESLDCILEIAERDARECGEEDEAEEKRVVIDRVRPFVEKSLNLLQTLELVQRWMRCQNLDKRTCLNGDQVDTSMIDIVEAAIDSMRKK